MKILMMTNTYLPIVGGLEKSIQSFSNKFRSWGHEVLIVAPEFEGAEESEEGILRVPSFHHFKRSDFSIVTPLSGTLTKVMENFKPDIIHAHHPFLMGEMALRLSARYARPLIFTYHIMFDQYSHYLPIPSVPARRFLVELAVGFANLSNRVLAPSESVRDILQAEGVRTLIDVVPTGIERSAFRKGNKKEARHSLGIPAQAFVLGYTGRMAPEKNLEFLGHAVAGFMKEHENVHFLMAGKGPSQEKIEKIFREAGLSSRFHWAGVLQGKKLADCYHAMNVFVFASKSETQGLVLCEAMACGVPVVAIDAPGVREVVRDFENGRLLDFENEKAFHAVLTWCFHQPSKTWNQLKQNAKKTAEQFSLDRCALHALEIYEAARGDYTVPHLGEQTNWHRMMERFRIEWKIMENFGRATGLALKEMATSSSGGEKS